MARCARVQWCVALLVGGVLACTSGGQYKAASLDLLSVEKATRTEGEGCTVVAGRIARTEDVVRVLGQRAGHLARVATVVQVSVTAGDAEVRLEPGSMKLELPNGRAVMPLEAARVLALASLPKDYEPRVWVSSPTPNPAESSLSREPENYRDPFMALAVMGMDRLDRAIQQSGARRYREAARADIEAKTAFPRTVPPDGRAELLAVFLPAQPIPPGKPVKLQVALRLGPRRVERTLTLE